MKNKVCQGILAVYFFIMTIVYPLYAPGGYVRIGEVKYLFFRNMTLLMLAAVGIVLALTALVRTVLARQDGEWILTHYRRMSVTDWFVYGYCLAVMLSYLCSPYQEKALWGAEGWYMGVMSQLMFSLLYFCFSRYFCCARVGFTGAGGNVGETEWSGRETVRNSGETEQGCKGMEQGAGIVMRRRLGLWLAASSVVFLLGICNRYSLYPVAMEGQTETFISTLGNINWFCGYWSVTASLGITLYWCSEKGLSRFLWGAYSFLAMLSGVTQGSNSAYLVFLMLLFVLLILSLQSNRRLYRFLELCMLFAAACQTGRLLQELPGLSYNYGNYGNYQTGGGSSITGILIGSEVTVWVFLTVLCCYVLLRLSDRRGHFSIERHKWMWGILTVAAAVTACLVIFLMMVDSEAVRFREVPGTMERDSSLEMVLSEDWGNGRGAAWMCGVDAYRSMDTLHKIVGIGPDCFAEYVYGIPEPARRLVNRFGNLRLTNAHNEWLTALINTGALGLFCYAGIFVTACVRFLKRGSGQPLLYVCGVALLAYTAHNMVSFQQILHTPYLFMILGIGEGLVRAELRYNKKKDGETTVEQ